MTKYKDIFEAIRENDIEAVKAFLPEQLEAKDKYGRTPFQLACYFGCIEIAYLLFEYNADIDAKSNNGDTALHWACYSLNPEENIIDFLLKHGADINARNKNGMVPLHDVCLCCLHKISEFLVSRGADPFIKNSTEVSPLDYDNEMVKDATGNKVPHSIILMCGRAEYLNKRVLKTTEHNTIISSGWEMEI